MSNSHRPALASNLKKMWKKSSSKVVEDFVRLIEQDGAPPARSANADKPSRISKVKRVKRINLAKEQAKGDLKKAKTRACELVIAETVAHQRQSFEEVCANYVSARQSIL